MVDLLVIGWDGADQRHLERIQPDCWSGLAHRGRLLPEPVYRGMPIDSGTAWTTITTGLPVEKHGFLSINNVVRSKAFLRFTKAIAKLIPRGRLRTYFYYGSNKLFNTRDRTPRSQDVGYKRVWDYIDGPCLTVEIPLTYPAWKTDGIMLSGIPAPLDGDQPSAYPIEYEQARQRYSGYNYMGDSKSPLQGTDQPNLQHYKEQIFQQNREAIDTVRDLADEQDFRMIFIVLPLIDDLLHALDPEDDRDQIEDAYRTLDDWTAELIDHIDPDDVLILSDHGMQPASQSLNPHQYPGLQMDHDPMHGIWASTHDFDLHDHRDVTPAILSYFSQEFNPEPYEIEVEEKKQDAALDDISV